MTRGLKDKIAEIKDMLKKVTLIDPMTRGLKVLYHFGVRKNAAKVTLIDPMTRGLKVKISHARVLLVCRYTD